jgi:hypothetical protein
VTESTVKQALNGRGLLAKVAEVQREIDFRATLQLRKRSAISHQLFCRPWSVFSLPELREDACSAYASPSPFILHPSSFSPLNRPNCSAPHT